MLNRETLVITVSTADVENAIEKITADYYEVIMQHFDVLNKTVTITGRRKGGKYLNKIRDFFK